MTDNQAAINLAKTLKELRTRSGYSHKRLSNELMDRYGIKISDDSLMQYEIDSEYHSKAKYGLPGIKMRVDTLYCLADLYGVSLDYLLGLTKIETVLGNEQSAASLDLPEKFISHVMFIDANSLTGEKKTLKMVLSDNRFFDAINAITLTRTALFQESPQNHNFDHSELDSLRRQVFELSGGAHSIIHSTLAVKSLLYTAEKLFSEVAENCVSEFCEAQQCDYPLDE